MAKPSCSGPGSRNRQGRAWLFGSRVRPRGLRDCGTDRSKGRRNRGRTRERGMHPRIAPADLCLRCPRLGCPRCPRHREFAHGGLEASLGAIGNDQNCPIICSVPDWAGHFGSSHQRVERGNGREQKRHRSRFCNPYVFLARANPPSRDSPGQQGLDKSWIPGRSRASAAGPGPGWALGCLGHRLGAQGIWVA